MKLTFVDVDFVQLRPQSTAKTLLFTPPIKKTHQPRPPQFEIPHITICSVSDNDREFSIFLDYDKQLFDDETTIYSKVPIKARETVELMVEYWIRNPKSSFGIMADAADALVFTLFYKTYVMR